MIAPLQQLVSLPEAVFFGWALVHFLWQGLVIAGLLKIALLFIHQKRASLRYLLCGVAMSLMPVCLTGTYLVLSGNNARTNQAAVSAQGQAMATPSSPGSVSPSVSPSVLQNFFPESTATDSALFDLNRYMPLVVMLWLVGVVLLAVRKTGGFVVVWRLRCRGLSLPSNALLEQFRKLCLKLGVDPDRVQLRISHLVHVPMTMGWLKPVVLFPAVLLSGLEPREIELLLAHELAHIRRYDYLVNILQTVVETLFFYHPVTWWISRRMRQERENACDDLIATQPEDVLDYVKALARLETMRPAGEWLASTANGGSLLQRLERLAGETSPTPAMGLPVLLTLVGLLVLIAAFPLVRAETKPATQPQMTAAEAKQKGIAALVNKKAILWSEVDVQTAETAKLLAQNLSGTELKQKIAENRSMVLQALIDRELIIESFKNSQGFIPQEFVNERINDIVREEFGNDRDSFLKTLAARGISVEQYKSEIINNAIVGYMRSKHVAEKITEYYLSHLQLFPQDELLNVSIIGLKSSLPAEAEDTATESKAPSDLAHQLWNRIQKGADFDIVAKRYHESTGTDGTPQWVAEKGPPRLMSWLAYLWPTLDKMQVGQTTDVIAGGDSAAGYSFIIRVNARRAAVPLATNDPSKSKEALLNIEAQRVQKEWLDGLVAKAVIQTFADRGWGASSGSTRLTTDPAQGVILTGQVAGSSSTASPASPSPTILPTSAIATAIPPGTAIQNLTPDEGRIYHAQVYQQTKAGSAKLVAHPYQFIVDIRNTVPGSTGTVSLPPRASWPDNPVTVVAPGNLVGAHFLYAQGFDSEADLHAHFPNGDYVFNIGRKKYTKRGADWITYTVPLTFFGSSMPSAVPVITNSTWNSGELVLQPSAPVITYTGDPGGTVTWEIVGKGGMSAGSWNGVSTGTLTLPGIDYGQTYQAQLRFIRPDNSITVVDPFEPSGENKAAYTYSTQMATIVQFTVRTPAGPK